MNTRLLAATALLTVLTSGLVWLTSGPGATSLSGAPSTQRSRSATELAASQPRAHPVRCLDLPISSALIQPDSCWSTGPTSLLVAGSSPAPPGHGAVAVIQGQVQKVAALAGSGGLRVVRVGSGAACIEDAHGRYHVLNLGGGTLATPASGACPTRLGGGGNPAQLLSDSVPLSSNQGSVPPTTPSYYEYYQYVGECPPGAGSACPLYQQGQATSAGAGLVVLDFGAPCSTLTTPALYGSQLFEGSVCTPDSSLQQLVQAWSDGYESDHGAGTPAMILAIGTSNSQNAIDPNYPYEPASLRLSAQGWYQLVAAGYSIPGSAPIVTWGASDIEQASSGWWDGTDASSWVQYYSQAAGFSTAQQCSLTTPYFLGDYGDDILGGSGSEDGWTAAQVYAVAQGIPAACAVPEIYYTSMATEWSDLSTAFQTSSGAPGITFTGVMVEAVSGTLTAGQAWTSLESQTGQAIPAVTQIASFGVYSPPPQVAAVAPYYGATQGGTQVTITGDNFATGATVNFGTAPATNVAVISPTSITATSPAGFPGRVDVTVNTSGGTSGTTAGDLFIYTVGGVDPTGYTPLAPVRICDTRSGNPSNLSGAEAQCNGRALSAGTPLVVNVAGLPGVPSSGVSAVMLNVTATDPGSNGYLTVYPAGQAAPLSSNLNFTSGETVANSVEVGLSASGQVAVVSNASSVDVIIDVEGFVASAPAAGLGLYQGLTPGRICDTRAGSGTQCTGHTMAPNSTMTVQVAGLAGVPVGAVAAVLNVTATNTTQTGYLTVFPSGTPPTASNLNWPAGATVANLVVSDLSSSGAVTIYNYAGTTDVVIDVMGYYTAAGGFGAELTALPTPTRICDTRAGSGTQCTGHTMAANSTMTVQVTGLAGVPASATAVVINVTATNTTAAGYLTVFPSGTPPLASNLNWGAGMTVPNLVIATLSSSGAITVYNYAGTTDVVIDVLGYYS
jgi:hypothetical protein